MPYVIRPAVPEDLPTLLTQYAKLYAVLAGFSFPFSLNTDDLPGLLSAQTHSKLARVLVAEKTGNLCGFVVVTVSRLDRRLAHPAGMLIGTIQDIFVEESERGQGCAEALLQAAQAWLCDSGVHVLEAFVAGGNHPSAKFFAKQGFSEMGTTLYKEI